MIITEVSIRSENTRFPSCLQYLHIGGIINKFVIMRLFLDHSCSFKHSFHVRNLPAVTYCSAIIMVSTTKPLFRCRNGASIKLRCRHREAQTLSLLLTIVWSGTHASGFEVWRWRHWRQGQSSLPARLWAVAESMNWGLAPLLRPRRLDARLLSETKMIARKR